MSDNGNLTRNKPTVTLRMPQATLDQWREEHARTYAIHRLSFPVWLQSRIDLSFGIKDETVNPPLAD